MNVKQKKKCESNANMYLQSIDKTWKDEVFHGY